MKRTISLKLTLTQQQEQALLDTQCKFARTCNQIVPIAIEHRCWNRVALHHHSYYSLRKSQPELGSQMTCNAINKVCMSYKALKIKKTDEVPSIEFKHYASIHYDKRTYSIKGDTLSLFTTTGRIKCNYQSGDFQQEYLQAGIVKEAELIRRGNYWFFNLVIDMPDVPYRKQGGLLAVDVGENNLATTSVGTIHGGGKLRHDRDIYLSVRNRLQSNGSQSAKKKLKRISGKERRHVRESNHIVSKAIVQEANDIGAKKIVMENLTNIRKRIKGNKRLRSRLHRWAWDELQQFIEYKAQAAGIEVVYVNPAYTSQKCSRCDSLGTRSKHRFKCSNCGSYQHSDRNAAVNLLKLDESVVSSTASVNMPMVVVNS